MDRIRASGIAGTFLTALDRWQQEELMGPIEGYGIAGDETKLKQSLQALRRAAGGHVTTVTDNAALTPDQAGLVIVNVTGARSITLPRGNAAGGKPIRYDFARFDLGGGSVTISPTGSDTIEGAGPSPCPTRTACPSARTGTARGGWPPKAAGAPSRPTPASSAWVAD